MAFYFNGNTPKKILYNGLNVAKLIYNGVVVWLQKALATIEGILPLTLTNSTGDDLINYKIYGNTEETGLPIGYAQVEYLESNGTQYIDTRYYPNNLTDVECKFMFNQLFPGDAGSSAFGVTESYSVKQFSMSVSLVGVLWIANGLNYTDIPSVRPVVNTEYILRITPQKAYWNGTEILTMTKSVANCPNFSMFAFGLNTTSGLANKFYGKIYYLKIYESGVLVRNFIPCINQSNVAGMYDTVNGVFYTNAGTGTFNVGSVVPKESVGDLVTDTSDTNYGKYKIPVLTNSHTTNIYLNKPLRRVSKLPYGYTELEHIRGTGTQYIDIGRKMYNNSELELCFSFEEMQQDCSIFGSRQNSSVYNFEIASTNSFPLYLDFGNFSTSRATYNNAAINTKYICTISKSLRAIYDENHTLLARNTTGISADNTTPSNARIFDTVNGFSANKLKGKVYYCKIWENGVLIRDMIPCKNPSNVVGMYDTVNDVFYTNAGSGSFVAGAEVETVYYTDYLDYENQKVVRNVDDNDKGIDTPVEESVTLPAVPTDEGTVTVDVGTNVTPSYAEVVYYKNDV